jgi:hypothetical protein
MNKIETKPDEVQFVVGEDWSFGPSRGVVAIPVINGDISKQEIKSETVQGLAVKCSRELHSCLIVCEETPVLEADYLADAGDRRARYVLKSREEETCSAFLRYLAEYANQ